MTTAGVTRPGSRMGGVLWLSWNLIVADSLTVVCIADILGAPFEELDEKKCES